MQQIRQTALIAFIAVVASTGYVGAEVKEGSISIPEATKNKDGVALKGIGKATKVELYVYFSKMGNLISASPKVTNPTKNTMHCIFEIAFFDKDGNLVGCNGHPIRLEAGGGPVQCSCLMDVPREQIPKIVRYQLRYEEHIAPPK